MIKKLKFNSPVILTFVILSFMALVLDQITNGYTNNMFFSVYPSSLASPFFYVRLVGHVLGHANWTHFSGNITILLLVGPLLEEKYGSRNIGAILLVTALLTGLCNVIFFSNGLLGASGIVFAMIMLSSLTGMEDTRIPVTFILVALIYVGGQIVDGVIIKDNISNITHIIGGILGGSFGFILNRKKVKVRMG